MTEGKLVWKPGISESGSLDGIGEKAFNKRSWKLRMCRGPGINVDDWKGIFGTRDSTDGFEVLD